MANLLDLRRANTKRLRQQARRKLKRLYQQYFGICNYCGEFTVRVGDILPEDIIKVGTFDVRYIKNGKEYIHPIATADHILDLELGGDSSLQNLVLACSKCNKIKDCIKQGGFVYETKL